MGIIERITSKTELKLAQIERELGFGNGTMRKWDISFPSFDKVIAVADLIGVSVDYLAGRETKIESIVIPYDGNRTELKETMEWILNNIKDENQLNQIKMYLETYKK